MPLVAVANGQFTDAGQLDQLINLLTGVMNDQPVNLKADNAHAPALLTLDTVNAGVQLGIQMKDAGVTKWEIIKLNDNHWALYDEAAGAIVFEFASNGGGIGSIGGLSFITGLGLGGATSGAMRFVGTTPFGPPLTGTFAVSDYIVDLTTFGRWVCIVAGTPGTWVALEGAITSPPAPTVVVNTAGATSWWYKVVPEGKNGSTFYDAIPSAAVKITNGAAVPNNTINWTAPIGVDASKVAWVVLRSSDGITYSRIAFPGVGVLTFTDNNAGAVAYTVSTFNPGGGFVLGGLRARCSVKQSTNIADTGGADIVLPLDTIVYDFTNQLPSGVSSYSTANKQFTAPISGLYQINVEATIPNNTAGDRSLTIFVNGLLARSLAQQTSSAAGGNPRLSGSATLYLNAGDVVEIRVAAPGATAGVISGGNVDYIYVGS